MKRFALVTGASQGIGSAIASNLIRDGYDIILHYRHHPPRSGPKIHPVSADITDQEDLRRLFTQIRRLTPRLDCLVNNAGTDLGLLLEDYSLDQIKLILDTNLFGTIAVTKLAIPLLKKSKNPCLINIASRMGGPTTIPTISAYGASKAGIIKFSQACAVELAKYRIRCNSISPGMTNTQLARSTYPKSVFKSAAQTNPRGRICQPQDVANLVSFLVSDKADYLNGTDILLTGGSHLK
jgi:3-oxoacyl-[acyl-carrier protein] reductase